MSETDPEAVARLALQRQRLLFARQTVELMRRPEFRAWAMWLIDGVDWCKAAAITFDPASSRRQDYDEGRRSVGAQLREHLQDVAAELFMRAQNEQPNLRAALRAPPEEEKEK